MDEEKKKKILNEYYNSLRDIKYKDTILCNFVPCDDCIFHDYDCYDLTLDEKIEVISERKRKIHHAIYNI